MATKKQAARKPTTAPAIQRGLATEEWSPIRDYEGRYDVSSLGRVRSLLRPGARVLKPVKANHGKYVHVALSDAAQVSTMHYVHRLVLRAFRGDAPEDCVASHLNGDGCDNRLTNLAWESQSTNLLRKNDHGTMLHQQGTANGRAKLTEADVQEIHIRGAAGEAKRALARRYGVNDRVIRRILNGELWRHVEAPQAGVA